MTTTTALLTSESEENLESFNYSNVKFVNFDAIITSAYKDVLRFCNKTGLEINFKKKDVSKLFFNYVVERTTQLYLSSKTKTCLLTQTSLYTDDVLSPVYVKTIKRLQLLLPIRIVSILVAFETLNKQINSKIAEAIHIVDSVIAHIHNEDFAKFSYRKIKLFLKREGFTQLYTMFKSDHKIKHALLYK